MILLAIGDRMKPLCGGSPKARICTESTRWWISTTSSRWKRCTRRHFRFRPPPAADHLSHWPAGRKLFGHWAGRDQDRRAAGVCRSVGPFGSTTSDSERAMVRLETTRILMVFISFLGSRGFAKAGQRAAGLLERYAAAGEIENGCDGIGAEFCLLFDYSCTFCDRRRDWPLGRLFFFDSL